MWRQRVIAEGHAEGYDGVINDYYLIKTNDFEPHGSLGPAALRAENIPHFRWWTVVEIESHRGNAVFAPRSLSGLLTDLLTQGVPEEPRRLGL